MDVQKIIDTHNYLEIAEAAGISQSLAKKWKTGEKDWRGSRFDKVDALRKALGQDAYYQGRSILNKDEKEMEKQLKFEEDVEKYGKSVSFDEAVSDIFANLPESLEIGDTQTYRLSGADRNGNSAGFDFEIVAFDEDEKPIFEYTGFNSII